ncbi:hypothetical protein EYZ11_010257 [Aspergillus tanneri]|uniref:Uncharacterized protein n=1 Tax=Aspergillus tanneri TaxID=1220188 RepID=A0A4S3JB70_9EURO|nr:uncharacterized protein ATNIH1004_003452 [Aspergillus tanneri]KAA8650763.1 hypothetical protein ATNIH1004_003452 [Aspergillus tanneri]THC90281.1 hypothetical protein EYZ11_010257 [Aspergillus tanneri]
MDQKGRELEEAPAPAVVVHMDEAAAEQYEGRAKDPGIGDKNDTRDEMDISGNPSSLSGRTFRVLVDDSSIEFGEFVRTSEEKGMKWRWKIIDDVQAVAALFNSYPDATM